MTDCRIRLELCRAPMVGDRRGDSRRWCSACSAMACSGVGLCRWLLPSDGSQDGEDDALLYLGKVVILLGVDICGGIFCGEDFVEGGWW